ncbi:MAG TPA: transketolase [Acidobacteriaceae bacterium]
MNKSDGEMELEERLRRAAARVRMSALEMVHHAKVGHPGGDLSAADVLVTLYLAVLRIDAADPLRPDRDRFIMSKGHCSGSFYSTLAEAGLISAESLRTYMDPLSKLNGHPDRNKLAGVEANTGPLGHGLPIGVGCALAAKMQRAAWRVFVLTGDGELQEGTNWEAAMTAATYNLDNLVVIVDRNRIQQGDFTEKTIRMDPLPEKWTAFGWGVVEVDGHDHSQLRKVLGGGPVEAGKPTCVIANTVKGRGVSFMENKPEWHHGVPTEAQLEAAREELLGALV